MMIPTPPAVTCSGPRVFERVGCSLDIAAQSMGACSRPRQRRHARVLPGGRLACTHGCGDVPMVSFELSDEERLVQQVAHDFAKKEIRPVAAYYDEREEVPYDIIKKAAAVGFGVSRQGSILDGGGSSLVPSILAEELSWGCAGIALAINSSGLAGAAIMATGSQIGRASCRERGED